MIDIKLIGKRLRTLRESLSLSQAKLAELLGITQSSLNRYENGQSTPTVELFRKYADFFDVSVDYIFARCDEPQGKLYHYQPKVEKCRWDGAVCRNVLWPKVALLQPHEGIRFADVFRNCWWVRGWRCECSNLCSLFQRGSKRGKHWRSAPRVYGIL